MVAAEAAVQRSEVEVAVVAVGGTPPLVAMVAEGLPALAAPPMATPRRQPAQSWFHMKIDYHRETIDYQASLNLGFLDKSTRQSVVIRIMAYFAYRDKRSGLVRLFRGPVQEPARSNGFSSRGLVYVHATAPKSSSLSAKLPPSLIPQLGSTNPLSSKRMNFEKWSNFWVEASGSTILMLSEESVYLIIQTPRSFWVPPGQLTANAHKYVGSYILRCCALDRTPTLDEFLVLFSIGGAFPYYSLFPHPQSPVFERVESKIDKWAYRYFVIEFPVHSPIDLSDARWYKKAVFYYPLGPVPIPFEGVSSPERSKASPAVESHPAESSSRNQAQGNATALAICKPSAALDAIPISAIPGLRKPTPSRRRPREGVTDDDFLPKKSKGDGILASPSPLIASSGTQNTTTATASGGLELPNPDSLDREADEFPEQAALKRPALSLFLTSPSPFRAQQSLLTLIEEYLGGAWGNYRAMVLLKEKELAARALQRRVGSLEQQVQALQEDNAKVNADGSAELKAERSRVKSLQEQIAIYQQGTEDLEMQFDKLRAQISSLESKASALEDKVGSLKAELVERETANELMSKQEGAHFSDLMLKHIGAKRLALEKLEKERKTSNELRSKMGELEKTMASHQEEVAALTARAEALYEDGKFDMQHCIYEAIRSGLPAHQSLDDFISYYGLPLPLPPPDSHANQEP
ncbi:unnamed protein product [Cuscuta campestris]|uniref:Uncharacterized protein n=1 Tax=Cuscuta campestris TaxID=132261 RepID=A0A484LM09_9ASTE|nr:unnamed protein product [Cuscuta campestris]